MAKADSLPDVAVIPAATYRKLLEDQEILNALYAGGVDNWEWFGESLAAAGLLDDEEEDDDDD